MDASYIAISGLALTALVEVVTLVWAVASIKSGLTAQITAAKDETHDEFVKLRNDFHNDQKAQDHNFGEVGLAMRQYIANVEKKITEVEIFGRDHYVRKDEFLKATDALGQAIKDMAADIKSDFRDISAKIDQKS